MMSNSVVTIIGSGIPASAANAIGGTIATGLTATGSTQGTALLISANYNQYSTVALSTGAILPSTASPGDEFETFNMGGNALSVYPPSGAAINGGSANAAVSVAANKSGRFVCLTPTVWGAVVSA